MFQGEGEPTASSKWPALSESNFNLCVHDITPKGIPLLFKNTLQFKLLYAKCPHSPWMVTRGKHIAPSYQHYKWKIHWGREGITEHRTGGRRRKSQREHQLSVEKPSQGFSYQYFCSTCNNRNASKVEDITEWALYMESDDSEPELSKNYMIKRQKRETEGKSHLTEEILELRDNKFNITEEACFRGRSLRSRQCPHLDSALT